MDQQSTAANPANGASTPHDLFALTDEQILEIEPEAQDTAVVGNSRSAYGEGHVAPGFSPASGPDQEVAEDAALRGGPTKTSSPTAEHEIRNTGHESRLGATAPAQPPAWLAEAMNDPQRGGEARTLWEGAQKAEREAAAYRAVFATPEDARTLKALYPGGVNEARAAAERARSLDEIDAAYFGAEGNSPAHTAVARAQLAATLLRQDPAAFREMVFAGLRALEESEKGSGSPANSSNASRLTSIRTTGRDGSDVAPPFRAASVMGGSQQIPARGLASVNTVVGAQPAAAGAPVGNASASDSQVAAYVSFEKAANEELERNVGGAIERTVAQALPNLQRRDEGATVGARRVVPLQDRLGAAIRQDVEKALQGDRQLGEQVAQILSARRFDEATRAQIVRLIGDRAQQLVPSAARRVINEWTQTTLAAHRAKSGRDAATPPDIEPAVALGASPAQRHVAHGDVAQGASPAALSAKAASRPDRDARSASSAARSAPGSSKIDYRKLSDEQILEM